MTWLITQFVIGVLVVSTPLNARTPDNPYILTAPEASQEVGFVSTTFPILPADLMAAGGCESNDSPNKKPRQFDENGEVVKHINKNGSIDYGAFQINDIHIPEAQKLGLDIMKELDNYKMAAIIYKSQGIGAWKGYDSARKTCSYYPKAS